MTAARRRLIRLAVRFQNAVDAAHVEAAEQYDRDSEFDAGEWSGPAIERGLRREEVRIAERFGFANADLAYGVADLLGAVLRTPAHLQGPASFYGAAPLPQ